MVVADGPVGATRGANGMAEPADGHPARADGFRCTPPRPRTGWIHRPRLVRRLERRFDSPLTVVAAPAGYGKTAALCQAIAAGADPTCVDAWLQCTPADADADVFGSALLVACGVDPPRSGQVTSPMVADALARFAPRQVCLTLDDAHEVAPESTGAALLQRLIDSLPHNAHLLLACRSAPPLRLARHHVRGDVDWVGVGELEYDDEELARATATTPLADADVARWPALVALAPTGGRSASVQFLLDEVGASLGPERLAVLTALAHVRDIDDDTVAVASGGRWTADELLGDLPLVLRSATGGYQLHGLWHRALADPVRLPKPPGATDALVALAEQRAAHGPDLEAAELFAAAGHAEGVARVATAFAHEPLTFVAAAHLRRVAALASEVLGDTPLVQLLEVSAAFAATGVGSPVGYERAAQRAREANDPAIEALALQNAANLYWTLDAQEIPEWLGTAAHPLVAAGHRAALVASVLARATDARVARDPELACAIWRELSPPTFLREAVAFAFGMGDLGRPEEVPTAPDLGAAVGAASSAGGHYLAQAMWLRGDVSPELAHEAGESLAEATDARGIAHVQASTYAVLCFPALATGDAPAARRSADQALQRSAATASAPARALAAFADAMCRVGEAGEAAAAERLRAAHELAPIGSWPPRPYLYSLPATYLLLPDARPALDRCRFGPALSAALRAGQALVALRERGDVAPSLDLPWESPWLLRVHVLPSHLAELAAAAAAAGHGEVGAVLDQLPRCREHLLEVASSGRSAAHEWAAQRAASMPVTPAYTIGLELLGPMAVYRGTTPVADRTWTRRVRVRELAAYLAHHRRVTRTRLIEDLWPQLDPERALGNLRVNLRHLNAVLQPARGDDEAPSFVVADGNVLSLPPDGWVLDVDRFDAACTSARQLDDRGRSTLALDAYERALGLYRGDYLEDWPDAEWAIGERFRLRTLAVTARTRLGELLLARGEPESAARHATAVLTGAPLDERAARLLSHALAAQGDRHGAAEVLRDLADRLQRAGLHPAPETAALLRRSGHG